MSGILDKCVFVIDQFIPLKKKVELIRMIKSNHGASVYSVSEKSTHLITSQEGFNEGSPKVVAAKNLGIHVVSKEFVVESVAQGAKQDEKKYYFVLGAVPTSPDGVVPNGNGVPVLTVSIPAKPASPAQNSATSSPKSPPGFSTIRTPTTNSPTINSPLARQESLDKKKFGRLKVDVNKPAETGKTTPSPLAIPSPTSPIYSNSDAGRSGDDDADEDDDDDDDEDEDDDEQPGSKRSFRDVLEHSNSSKQPRAWESATPQYGLEDDGCKIFVGGIMFDDLEALKKTKDGYSASEEVIAHIQKLKNERLIEIIRIFSRFGTVVRVKQFLEKRHIFITYDNKNSALQALRALKPLEVRKKIVQEVRERLRAEDRQTLVSPRSNFYVRWPHHVESEDGGYSSASRSYFSGSSAPSSPTGASLPTQKFSWRQPQSPTSAYQPPFQRSYFQNNFTNPARSTSMRSYFNHATPNNESDYEGSSSNNPNSFSESESSQYSRSARTQQYQPLRPDGTLVKTVLSESDSDAPTGIRHRVIDRSIDRAHTQDSHNPNATSTSSSFTTAASTSSAPYSSSSPSLPAKTESPPPSAASSAATQMASSVSAQQRRAINEENNWQNVLVLLLILAIAAIVYLYNK